MKNKREKIKSINLILSILSLVAGFVFIFLNINYKAESIICILLFIVTFIFYIKFNGVVSLEDNEKEENKDKINALFPLYCSAIALGVRSNLDFNLLSYKMLIIISSIIFVFIMVIFFVFTREYKKVKSCILTIILASLFFAPSATLQINYVFDMSPKKVEISTISNMEMESKSKGFDEYKLTVQNSSGKEMKLRVSKAYYRTVEIGDSIHVCWRDGLFNIPYVYAD